MTVPTQLATDPYRSLQPAGDTVERFQGVLDRYKDQYLQVPVHQRDAEAWGHEKRRKYVERLRESKTGSHPPGSFVTYQVSNDRGPSASYLNDGFQRLTTLLELEGDPAVYGMNTQGVRELLQQQISVQHRHYVSHEMAMRDFQLINNGTRLTPHELCIGFLKYMPNYDNKWKPLLDDVDKAVESSAIRLLKKRSSKKREEEHKLRRHTWALFHRFLVEEKRPLHYQDVAARDVERAVDRGGAIEQRLAEELGNREYEDVKRVKERFCAFVDDETAVLEQAVLQVLGNGMALAPTLHRWLLDLAVWRRTNRISREDHLTFLGRLLDATRGHSRWPREDEGDVTIGLSHLGLLPKLAELARMPEFCEPQRRRKGPQLKAGYDNSHLEPFTANGDGPTVPEPAPLNRARGAQAYEK